VEQRGMTEADARARIAAQAPLEAKLAAADLVIRNDGALDDLDEQVADVWQRLREKSVDR
jgi:dephospho-CoA kinase